MTDVRVIPTAVHAASDYPTAAALMALPHLAGFNSGPESTVPMAVGLAVLGQSLVTDYEGGVSRVVPMRTHLMNDVAAGAFLAASPWLFGFAGRVWLPHVLMGLTQVAAGLMTKTVPADRTGLPAGVPPRMFARGASVPHIQERAVPAI